MGTVSIIKKALFCGEGGFGQKVIQRKNRHLGLRSHSLHLTLRLPAILGKKAGRLVQKD